MAAVILSCASLFGSTRSVKLSSSFSVKNTQSRRLSLTFKATYSKHILNISACSKNKMPKRYLNVEHCGTKISIDVTEAEILDEVLLDIKAEFSNALAHVDAPELQLLDQHGQWIADLDDIHEDYYKKPENGGFSVIVRTTPPSSSPELSAFWDAFKTYSRPIEANTVVKLPENVSILGDDHIGSSIFIRPCYPELLKIALSIVDSTPRWRFAILGSPGIGKTFFGYFLLLHLAGRGETVVYETVRGEVECVCLFTPGGVFEGVKKDFSDFLDSPSTFYIVDGVKPAIVRAKSILLTSLCEEISRRFLKETCTFRHMPVWSGEEIHSCRALLYPSILEELAESLYLKWGGIPRYVLEFAFEAEQQALLEEALAVTNIDSVIQSLHLSGEKADASNRLIHLSVEDAFHRGPYVFASDYVASEIFNRVYACDPNHLINFVSATYSSLTSQLRGILFEKYAHTIISGGGTFKIRKLQKSNEENDKTELHLPTDLTVFKYSSHSSAFQRVDKCYFGPVSKIFDSVDSFIKPNLLFQMTGARNHPIKQAGLLDVLETLGNPLKPELYFVVPPDLFYFFKYQNYHGPDGTVLPEEDIDESVKKVSQFVLTYDTPFE